MSIRTRVEALLGRLASEPQFPTQGQTIFVDLERQEVRRAWIPRRVVTTLLGGRGVNMFLLHNLLDETLEPIHPDIPLIFGTGILTSMVPSASRGNVTSWSPESRVLMDSNAGDYFPSFMKLNGIDHLVLYGKAPKWTLLHFEGNEPKFVDAAPWAGLDNLDLRARIAARFQRRRRERLRSRRDHHRRREPRPLLRHHGRPEGHLRARRSRREDGSAEPEGGAHPGARRRPHAVPAAQAPQSRRGGQAAVGVGRQERAEEARHAVPLQTVAHARRDGDEEQSGDDLDRQARRREHRSVSPRDGGLLRLPRGLPPAERHVA